MYECKRTRIKQQCRKCRGNHRPCWPARLLFPALQTSCYPEPGGMFLYPERDKKIWIWLDFVLAREKLTPHAPTANYYQHPKLVGCTELHIFKLRSYLTVHHETLLLLRSHSPNCVRCQLTDRIKLLLISLILALIIHHLICSESAAHADFLCFLAFCCDTLCDICSWGAV